MYFITAQICLSPDLVNGEISSDSKKNNFKTGDVIHYQCKSGYHFKGSISTKSTKTRCNEENRWEPKPRPCYGMVFFFESVKLYIPVFAYL